MRNWEIQSFQLVWFLAQQENISASDVFRKIVGVEPASQSSMHQGQFSNAFGEYDQKMWSIQKVPERIDLILNSLPKQGYEKELPRFAELDPTLNDMLIRARNISENFASPPRIALVTKFLRDHANTAEANRSLREELGLNLNFDDFSDLVLQLNRRKILKSVPGQSYNRLLKWSAESYQLSMSIPGSFAPAPLAPLAISVFSVDLNTIQNPGVSFNPRNQASIFAEWYEELKRLRTGIGPKILRD